MKKWMLMLCLLLSFLLVGCGAEEYQEEETPWYAEEEQEPPAEENAKQLPESFALAIHRSRTLDPVTCSEGTQQYVGSLLYEPLFALDEGFEPVSVLCESMVFGEDGRSCLITLRQGVYFGDGSELSAKDVVTTLRRAMNSERYAARLRDIATVSATRDGAVQITLWKENARLAALLDIPIVKAGTENDPVPAGTGPYLFITDGDSAYLSARSNWWQGKKMPLERIELVDAKDGATVQYLFTSREVQLYAANLSSSTTALMGSLDYLDAPTTLLHYLGVNTASPLLSSAAVRRCISAGIDRSTVTTGFLSGHAREAKFPIAPESPQAPAMQGYRHEEFVAAAELASLLTGEKRPLRLLVNAEGDEKLAIAEYIAQSLADCDLDITVVALPWQEYLEALAAGEFDLYYAEVKLTADWDVSSMLLTGGALNYGGWSNPKTDLLLAEYASSGDGEAFYQHFAEEMPMIPICFENLSVLTHRDTVKDMTPTMSNVFYQFNNWTVRLAESKE